MTTGNDVFALAMNLIDELDPQNGRADRGETRAYKVRVAGLLHILLQELCQFDDSWLRDNDRDAAPSPVDDLDAALDLGDRLCRGVLPFGLAGLLILEENPPCAQVFLSSYRDLKLRFSRSRPARKEEISRLYGGV